MPGPVSDSLNMPDGDVIRCAYCGHEYPPGTPPSQHEALTEHIKICPAHPMTRLKQEVRKLVRACNNLQYYVVDGRETMKALNEVLSDLLIKYPELGREI